MKKIEIEIPDGKRAEWVDGVLTLVDESKPESIMDRVKTFEDALNELDLIHPFVKSYYEYADSSYSGEWKDADILAYLKLRIICAALNEGWQPKFTEDERLYYPWFSLYSKGELENMSENNKKGVVYLIQTTMKQNMRVSPVRTCLTPPRIRLRASVLAFT